MKKVADGTNSLSWRIMPRKNPYTANKSADKSYVVPMGDKNRPLGDYSSTPRQISYEHSGDGTNRFCWGVTPRKIPYTAKKRCR